MVTDPPYGVRYNPRWREGMRKGAVGRAVLNDDRIDWSEAWALFPGDVAYIWHAGSFADAAAASLRSAGFEIRAQIVWAKDAPAISRGHYHWQHEPCFYAVRRGAVAHWNGDRKQSTLWRIPSRTRGFIRSYAHYSGHGAQKPVEAMARPMRNNSRPGDLVYDPFLGSGTTIIAAEREGRICYGIELDPACCEMVLRRWRAECGGTVRRVSR